MQREPLPAALGAAFAEALLVLPMLMIGMWWPVTEDGPTHWISLHTFLLERKGKNSVWDMADRHRTP